MSVSPRQSDTQRPSAMPDPADFDGDIVATRVAPKVIIDRADERIRIALGTLVQADERAIWVSGSHLQLGTEPDSQVNYRVVGWDAETGCLLAERTDARGSTVPWTMDRPVSIDFTDDEPDTDGKGSQ